MHRGVPTVLAAGMLMLCGCTNKGPMEAVMDQRALIPRPTQVESVPGSFTISGDTIIFASDDASVRTTAAMLSGWISDAKGPALMIKSYQGARRQGAIHLALEAPGSGINAESYSLRIGPDEVFLGAPSPEGVFRGAQTLRQMILAGPGGPGNKTVRLPGIVIRDAPRFPWRGLNLDCSRHFYPKDFIKRCLDLLALYKMNVFHWHLTDDQGWRLEIKKYPRLAQVSAFRKEGGADYGGLYTRDDVREIVEYARERFITVVPEIEMPGHCQAVLAAYPELSCTGGPFKVSARWGIHRDVFCAGSEDTFRFLGDVLAEVAAMFPGKYIHIGGDECPKFRWKACPRCQARMKELGLRDEKELQSWFITRAESMLAAHGRRLIGWDEILEGGLPESATVQSWRGVQGAVEAVKQGRRAIVSPTSHTYFDYGLAITSLETVYSFEPIPPGIPEDRRGLILGSEANMWSEYATVDNVEEKLFPRMLALSETLWSRPEGRDYDEFHGRLQTHYGILDARGVRYGAEREPGILKAWYFMRDLRTLFGMIADDPGIAWHTMKLYLGMKGDD
ncbi:MAG: beta-N-acetylglucosaminidase [Spirochaetes bacterium]|nr:MAG: beta-N-acetylglucosaminidase [Spirochaetota bacterium]